jgi:hypothetical protein
VAPDLTALDRLAGPLAKVERAKHHLQEVGAVLAAFFDTKPYVFAWRQDPRTRRVTYYLTSVTDVPPEIAVLAGEVIQSLRSALDQLAYQLVLVGTGKPGPFTHVYFPIFDSVEKYRGGKHGQTKGMDPRAIKAIDALQPYRGGNDQLWQLHRLNIIDKHRLLVTVGSTYRSFDLGREITRGMREMAADVPWLKDVPDVTLHLRPAEKMFPLKAGDELFITAPDSEPDPETQFQFEVALHEPGIIEHGPVVETLQQMVELVDGLIPTFRPLLE